MGTIKLTSKSRIGSASAPIRRSGQYGQSAQSTELRCRVVRKTITDKPPGKPDWDRIPSRRQLTRNEADWEELIAEHAKKDGVHGAAMSGQSQKLLVEYISQFSPDRRRMYEALFARYGEKLESYKSGDGSNMRNVRGVWKFDMTVAEKRSAARFMRLYIPIFEAVSKRPWKPFSEEI